MTSSLASVLSTLLAQAPTLEELNAKVDLDSLILLEVFYFFTVVIMWLIHVGFMAYEAGVARRKNIMSTAMKNILTIAVVTPSFYYFGWYIYGCFEHGGPAEGHAGPAEFPGFCGLTAPWSEGMAGNLESSLTGHLSLVFFLAFLLFSWTTASIMSGALIERVRLSAYLILAVVLGSGVWIMDAAWGWSAGGWLTTNYGFHDSIASLVVHGVAGAFTLGVLLMADGAPRSRWALLAPPMIWCLVSGATLWAMGSPEKWILLPAAIVAPTIFAVSRYSGISP